MNVFKLKEYLAKYEFSTQYLFCCSDTESFEISDILDMVDNEENNLWNNLRLSDVLN